MYFLLGEVPFITNLYERARATLGDDAQLSIDGVKELLLERPQGLIIAMKYWRTELRKITPRTLATCLKYIQKPDAGRSLFFSATDNALLRPPSRLWETGYALSVLETGQTI